jgi:hypothetical protein
MWQRQISTLFEFTSKIRLLCLRYPYDTVRDGKKNIGHDEKKKKGLMRAVVPSINLRCFSEKFEC